MCVPLGHSLWSLPWTKRLNTQLWWKLRYSPIHHSYLEPSVRHNRVLPYVMREWRSLGDWALVIRFHSLLICPIRVISILDSDIPFSEKYHSLFPQKISSWHTLGNTEPKAQYTNCGVAQLWHRSRYERRRVYTCSGARHWSVCRDHTFLYCVSLLTFLVYQYFYALCAERRRRHPSLAVGSISGKAPSVHEDRCSHSCRGLWNQSGQAEATPRRMLQGLSQTPGGCYEGSEKARG